MTGAFITGLHALQHAEAYVGVREQPPGSNRGGLIDQWNAGAGVPAGSEWCMSFAHAMFRLAGVTLGGWASVGNFELWANQHGYLIRRPYRGDIGCLDWNADNWPDHAVIVERVLGLRWFGGRFVGWIRYIAGNDGDAVSRRVIRVMSTARFARIP